MVTRLPVDWLLYIVYPTFMFAGMFAYVQAFVADQYLYGIVSAALICITASLLSEVFMKPLHCAATLLAAICAIPAALGNPFAPYIVGIVSALIIIGMINLAISLRVPETARVIACAIHCIVLFGITKFADIYIAVAVATCIIIPFLFLLGYRRKIRVRS